VESLQKVIEVVPQVRFVSFHRDAVDSRYFASFHSAKCNPEQLIVEQRKEIIENPFGLRFGSRFGSLCDAIEPPR